MDDAMPQDIREQLEAEHEDAKQSLRAGQEELETINGRVLRETEFASKEQVETIVNELSRVSAVLLGSALKVADTRPPEKTPLQLAQLKHEQALKKVIELTDHLADQEIGSANQWQASRRLENAVRDLNNAAFQVMHLRQTSPDTEHCEVSGCDNDMQSYKCPNNKRFCLDHCADPEQHEPPKPPRKYQSILVAFSVVAETEEDGVEKVSGLLGDAQLVDGDEVDCWWVAEDSSEADCDSAVFVKPGCQNEARSLLFNHQLAN